RRGPPAGRQVSRRASRLRAASLAEWALVEPCYLGLGRPARGHGYRRQDLLERVLGTEAAHVRVRRERESVAQHRSGERLHVVGGDVVPSLGGCPSPGGALQGEGSP